MGSLSILLLTLPGETELLERVSLKVASKSKYKLCVHEKKTPQLHDSEGIPSDKISDNALDSQTSQNRSKSWKHGSDVAEIPSS